VSYADERLELYARLRQAAQARPLAELFRLDGRQLRFHLGTSLADLRLPISVDPALVGVFEAAALDLFTLLCARHRAALREGEFDQILLLDGFDPKATRSASFHPPASVARDGVKRAFLEAPELHPALDCGLVAAWISQGRPGRTLVGTLHGLLRRAIDESSRSDLREPTPYLVLLALRSIADTVMQAPRRLPIAAGVGRMLLGAVSVGLLLATRLAAREAGLPTLPADFPGALLAESAIGPLVWLGHGRGLLGSGLSAYGLVLTDVVVRLDPYVQRAIAGTPPEQLSRDLYAELVGNKELAAKVDRVASLMALRNELFQLARLAESGRAPPVTVEGLGLHALYSQPTALERILGATDRRAELVARLKNAARSSTNEPVRQRLESLVHGVKEWSDDLSGARSGARPGAGLLLPNEGPQLFSKAAVALAIDLALDRLLAGAARSLAFRSGAESEDGLGAEHSRGRLYLLSCGDAPLLAVRAGPRQMGHLFCDVKDFTKRTAFLKEAVVADFLHREFYTPILTAAARHHHGAVHLDDKGGLYLNNLLGDAVSFSGDIAACVDLAHDIREALENYGRRLAEESGREGLSRSIGLIEERARKRLEQLQASIASAEAAQTRGMLDPESGIEPGTRLRQLHLELGALDDERKEELALVAGERLEAGIFISFGAAPEVATFEDHVFGAMKVAIAEKINESARGTARAGGVRARIDALLQQARLQRGVPGLTCPFQVFLSKPLSIPVSAALESQIRAALELGDVGGAQAALHASVDEFVERLAHEGEQQGGDIYNGGAALTEEALQAYLAARAGDLQVLRREIAVQALDPQLREPFVFPQQSLRLVCLVSPSTQSLSELFVYAGQALFKGLEKRGGLAVFEIIPRGSPFFVLLARHHVARWVRERGREDEGTPQGPGGARAGSAGGLGPEVGPIVGPTDAAPSGDPSGGLPSYLPR
jgi:class 3 adenylate cyclase